MKLPEPVAWSVTWDKCHCGNFFQREEYAKAHKQRLDAKFPQDAREVVGLFDEAQLRAEIERRDAVLKMALEALKRMERYGNTFLYRRDEQSPHEQTCEAIKALEDALK